MIYYAFLPMYQRADESDILFSAPARPKTNDAVRVRVTRRHAEPEPHSESSERAD